MVQQKQNKKWELKKPKTYGLANSKASIKLLQNQYNIVWQLQRLYLDLK